MAQVIAPISFKVGLIYQGRKLHPEDGIDDDGDVQSREMAHFGMVFSDALSTSEYSGDATTRFSMD